MNITTKYKIGQLMKVYFTPIKEGKITEGLGSRCGIIDEIKIQLDIITKQPIVLYIVSISSFAIDIYEL